LNYIWEILHRSPNISKFQKWMWQNLYALGARKIGVTTLPPLGCLPAAITLFGSHSNECVDRLNNDALNFNTKLNTTSQNLQKVLSNLTLAVLDIYQPLHDLVTKPTENGKFKLLHKCLFDFFLYILLLVMAHEQGLWIIFLLLHTLLFLHRVLWSKEGLLWNWLDRNIYIVQ